MAALAASLLFRGIPWISVPTTLLAMVDAGLGGKTAINVGGYKNQVGSFHRPRHLLLCRDFLESLPQGGDGQWSGGGREVLFPGSLPHDLVLRDAPLEELILSCAHYKEAITGRDPRDKGPRQLLNLGHTLGHAFESLYGLPHGVAVLWGMHTLFSILGRTSCLEEFFRLTERLNLTLGAAPWGDSSNFPIEAILEQLGRDKKRPSGTELLLIDCLGIGQVHLRPMALGPFRKLLEGHFFQLASFSKQCARQSGPPLFEKIKGFQKQCTLILFGQMVYIQ